MAKYQSRLQTIWLSGGLAMEMCAVYLRKGAIYVISQSLTGFGIGVSLGPMEKIETPEPRQVGEAVVAALNSSQSGIPEPDDLQQIQKQLFRFTGAKSWGDLVRTSAYVGVSRDGSTVIVSPHKPDGGAFVAVGPGTRLSSPRAEEIGQLVLQSATVH